jgi:diguanylate cyclase (GGDEF)-like protein/PAS domain S-box-containing protein
MMLNHLKNKHPTIAVLTNMMATPFSEGIIFGATDYAKQHAYNMLCFTGAEFAKPAPINMSRHRIFDLVDNRLIDGVILPMGALSRFISLEEQLTFLHKFGDLPVITITSDIPGYMNVGYSARQGMFDLIKHLVEHHGVQRFAFAGATGDHRSTFVKKQFFIEALNARGIHFDEQMYITSDMRRNAPVPGLEALFCGDKQLRPQAIVSGSDTQARDILTALTRLNIRVPDDVIVTGSMGHVESLFSNPPLTSIAEPTYELGWNAAKRVIAAIEGRPDEQSLTLPTSLIVRRSCGCNRPGDPSALQAFPSPSPAADNLQILPQLRVDLEQILTQAQPEHRTSIAFDTPQKLVAMLAEDLRHGQSIELVSLMHREYELCVCTEAVYLWGQLAQCIHRALMLRATTRTIATSEARIAASLFEIVQRCNEKAGRYRSFEAEKYVGILREIGIQLNSEFNPAEISQLLAHGLNIDDCYISLFESLDDSEGLVSSVMATRDGQHLPVCNRPYPAMQLLPPKSRPYDEVFALLVMPLSFKEDFLGFCVLSMGERKGVIYEGLLTLFSSALKNQMQMRNIKEAEKKFSDIAHSASDWLWEIDPKGRFTYCSEGVKKVLGYEPQALIGKPLTHFLATPDPAYTARLMQAMSTHSSLVDQECHCRHKDGGERVLLTTGIPVIKFDQIIGYRGAYKDISDVKAQEAHIRVLAYRDTLTDLPNRTLFNDRLNVMVATAQRTEHEFAVLFVDLDGFKLVNDSMGHDAGDLLLHEVAKTFAQCVREEDTLARFGGDEFVVLLPSINNGKEAAWVCERMIQALSGSFEIRDQSVFITASIGIAIYPNDGDTAQTLLKNADKAMYHSKQNGKNRFSFYEPELGDALNRAIMMRNSLHTALRDDGFKLLFQPQVDEKTRLVCGVEALIRLAGPNENLIGPAEFIPLAEEIGLIEQIGLWVFKETCQQQRLWADVGYNLKCSINVSAKQFRNPNLAQAFIDILQKTDIDPAMIVIEVTENAVIDNDEHARQTLQQLSDYGLGIAIDDFGTGYASLSCLRKMPIDILKIDRSFVNDCTTNEENASIIAAIVMMAKSLKLRIVAEGVETPEHLDFLGGLGCDEIQGYLFAKPLPEHQVLGFVQTRAAAVTTDPLT